MAQILKSLDAVTSDATGDVLSFNTPKSVYSMHYIATIPSGSANLYLEGSLDGVNYFTVQNITLSDNANTCIVGGFPALFIRARVSGLTSGRTVTALLCVM